MLLKAQNSLASKGRSYNVPPRLLYCQSTSRRRSIGRELVGQAASRWVQTIRWKGRVTTNEVVQRAFSRMIIFEEGVK
jgi:hypothetical protein